VPHELVELDEAAVVEQRVDALAGGQLALGVLAGHALGAAPGPRLLAALFEFIQDVLHAVGPLASTRTG